MQNSNVSQVAKKLLTCRYWALGPGCPNVVNGIDSCEYAHYDTGRLASPFDQRGTCLEWSKLSYCPKVACWYEHRHTGVTGLNQGSK